MRQRQVDTGLILPSKSEDASDEIQGLSQKTLLIIAAGVGLVVLYILLRAVLTSSPGGLSHFQPEYCYEISGLKTDVFYRQTHCWADEVTNSIDGRLAQAKFEYHPYSDNADFLKYLQKIKQERTEARWHYKSPIIFEGCKSADDADEMVYIGGYKEFVSLMQSRYGLSTTGGKCEEAI